METTQLVADYRCDGVVRCPSLFTAEDVLEFRAALARYHHEILPKLPTSDYTLEADGKTVRNFWRMHEHDPYFAALPKRPKLLELARSLVNGEPVVMGVETFNKPARVGSTVPAHQDNAYFCQTPADVVTAWIAIDAATEENGAVEYFLGSHQTMLPHRPSGVKGNSFGLADEPATDRWATYLGTVDPGDVLFHHCQTIHRSHPNHSDRPRTSLVVVYRGSHTQTDEQWQAAYREALSMTPQNA
jgi:phytanoyl-CoA hydroxylase